MTTTHPDLKPAPVRVSIRDIREGSYRALRAAGVPAGAADDTARDTLALEIEHHAGLRILAAMLAAGPITTPRPELVAHDEVTVASSGHLLLIAGPLVDIACANPYRTLRITGADEPIVLTPALTAASANNHVELCVTEPGHGCRAHIRPAANGAATLWLDTTNPAPSVLELHAVGPDTPHDLSGRTIAAEQRHAAWRTAEQAGTAVDYHHWTLVNAQSSRYLV